MCSAWLLTASLARGWPITWDARVALLPFGVNSLLFSALRLLAANLPSRLLLYAHIPNSPKLTAWFFPNLPSILAKIATLG